MAYPDAVYVSGTLTPDVTGIWYANGDFIDSTYPVYALKTNPENVFLYIIAGASWGIELSDEATPPPYGGQSYWSLTPPGTGENPSGSYLPVYGGIVGTAVVALYSDPDIRICLQEKDAKMVSIGTAGLPRTKQLTRRWEKLKDKLAQDCVDFLYEYTSADNLSPLYYVDDPQAVGPRGAETWTGRWRQVSVGRTAAEPQGVTEVLRLGFQKHSADSDDPLDQDEARLGEGTGTPYTGDRQYRQDWRYTDPSDLDEIMVDLEAIASVEDPTVEGNPCTGIFACSKIKSQPNEDGSILISRTLTEIHSIAAVAGLSSLYPVITQSQELLNLFGFEPGDEEKLLYIYSNIDPDSQEICCETITPAQLEAIPDDDWIFSDRKFVIDKDTNVATFAVTFMKETWDATYADRHNVKGGTLSGWLRNIALQVTGESKVQALADFQELVIDELGDIYAAANKYNKGDPAVYNSTPYICISPTTGTWDTNAWIHAHYLLNGKTLSHRGKGEYVVSGDMVAAYNGTAAADAIVTRAGEAFTENDRKVGVRVWFRRSEAAKDVLITKSSGEAWADWTYEGDDFVSHNWTMEDHQNGQFTVRQFGWVLVDTPGDGFVTRIKPGLTANDQEVIIRSWANLTEDAMLALTDWETGLARLDDEFTAPVFEAGRTFTHADCFIEDRTEAGYTVRQVLVYLRDGLGASDALVLQVNKQVTAEQQRIVVRVWATVSEAEKVTLVGTIVSPGIAYADFTNDGINFISAGTYIDDRGRGGYTIRQVGVELQAGVAESDALTIRHVRPSDGGNLIWTRVWLHKTEANKNALTTDAGKATSNGSLAAVTYYHQQFNVAETGNGGYNITQTLVYFQGGGAYVAVGADTWDNDYAVSRTETRSADDKKKVTTYSQKIGETRTSKDAWDKIKTFEASVIVINSDTVVKVGTGQYRYRCLTAATPGTWGA